MTEILSFIDKNEILSLALKFVLENNTAKDNPYHNNHHLLGVFRSAMKLTIGHLETKDITEIGLAALFHDFNHSGGKLTDTENIKLAITELSVFHINNVQLFTDKGIDVGNSYVLMNITEYPHKREPETIQEKIIRYSDMLQYYDENWFLNVVMGFLNKEVGLSIKDSIENQIKFVNNVKFYTEGDLYIRSESQNQILRELDFYSKIF